MTRNRFVLLLAITLAVGVLVVVLDRSPNDSDPDASGRLLPGLAEVVNDLDALDIVAPGGQIAVSLRRDDRRWRVSQRDGYEADFAQVLDLLRTLADVDVAEPRTSRASWYPELGVQDVGADDATGRRIDFPGRDIASVIVGQRDPSGEGSYARRAGEDQSWLLDAIVEVPVDPVAWLEPGIMDIPAEEIDEVIVRHADGGTVRLRVADDADRSVVLLDIPEGRDAGAAFKRNALANGLRGLELQDVRRFEPPAPDEAVRLLFRTVDGLNFVADVFERNDARWIHFTVSAETTPEEAPSTGESENETPADGEADGEGRQLADAVAVDARLSPWLFRITERRFDDLTPRMEDLLAPIEESEQDQAAEEQAGES